MFAPFSLRIRPEEIRHHAALRSGPAPHAGVRDRRPAPLPRACLNGFLVPCGRFRASVRCPEDGPTLEPRRGNGGLTSSGQKNRKPLQEKGLREHRPRKTVTRFANTMCPHEIFPAARVYGNR